MSETEVVMQTVASVSATYHPFAAACSKYVLDAISIASLFNYGVVCSKAPFDVVTRLIL